MRQSLLVHINGSCQQRAKMHQFHLLYYGMERLTPSLSNVIITKCNRYNQTDRPQAMMLNYITTYAKQCGGNNSTSTIASTGHAS